MRAPRPRSLCALAATLGLLGVVLLLAKPVEASFADDPLLRLQGFDRAPGALATRVDCGSVPASLGSTSPATLYTLARDDACQREGRRRLVTALAAGALTVLISLVVAVRTSRPQEGLTGLPLQAEP